MLRLATSGRLLTKVAAPKLNVQMPLRSLLTQQRPMLVTASLFRPSFMTFSTRNLDQTTAAETPGTLMQESTPIEVKFRRFFGQDFGEHSSLWLCALIEDCFLRRALSFEQHRKYMPLIDEVIFYVSQCDELMKGEGTGYNEAMTLLRFGLEYGFHSDGDVYRVKYWRAVKAVSTKALEQVKGDTEATLNLISLMKEAGILSNKAMRLASELINDVETLSAMQLAEFVLIYASAEMQSALDVSDNLNRLETALLAKSKQFDIV